MADLNIASIAPGTYINGSGKTVRIWPPGQGNQRDKLANIAEISKGGFKKIPEIPSDKKIDWHL